MKYFKSALLLCPLISLVFASSALADLPTTVPTESGLIQGVKESSLNVYRGIPYAAPPVGANRWREPQRVPQWSGVLDATTFAPQCVGRGFSPSSEGILTSEDCLYLNIWSPATRADEQLPVMLWIHGGGFFVGSGSAPAYDGASLASKGAVVITINYRLGSFGFFAHPELTAESPNKSSGNYALLDMIAAIQWVKNNIQEFGGDAENITVFGESVGSESTANLIASPLSKGLFQRAIMQSSGWMGFGLKAQTQLAAAEQEGLAQAKTFGADNIATLRSASTKQIFNHLPNAGRVVVDGYFLPEDASLILANGKQQKVDVIVGSNANEGAFFGPGVQEAKVFIDSVRTKYGAQADDYLTFFPAKSDQQANDSYMKNFTEEMAWQMRKMALFQNKLGSNAYVYFFTHVPPGQESRGATHVAELAYVFDQESQNKNWTKADKDLGDTVAEYWVNFARTGNPNVGNLPAWPVYKNHNKGNVQILGDTVHTEENMIPSKDKLNFFDEAFERQLKILK